MEGNTVTVDTGTFYGTFPVRPGINVLPADDTGKLKIGFKIKERLGMAVYNPVALHKLIPERVVVVNDEEYIGKGYFPENLRMFEE